MHSDLLHPFSYTQSSVHFSAPGTQARQRLLLRPLLVGNSVQVLDPGSRAVLFTLQLCSGSFGGGLTVLCVLCVTSSGGSVRNRADDRLLSAQIALEFFLVKIPAGEAASSHRPWSQCLCEKLCCVYSLS